MTKSRLIKTKKAPLCGAFWFRKLNLFEDLETKKAIKYLDRSCLRGLRIDAVVNMEQGRSPAVNSVNSHCIPTWNHVEFRTTVLIGFFRLAGVKQLHFLTRNRRISKVNKNGDCRSRVRRLGYLRATEDCKNQRKCQKTKCTSASTHSSASRHGKKANDLERDCQEQCDGMPRCYFVTLQHASSFS